MAVENREFALFGHMQIQIFATKANKETNANYLVIQLAI